MKLFAKNVLWLLPLLLTGCIFHKTHPAPSQSLAPNIGKLAPPSTAPVELPVDVTRIPAQPTENATVLSLPTPPPRPRRQVSKPAPETNPQQAANPSPEVSAIGQLSSGDPSDFWRQASESINSTERSLNAINRPLTGSEQVTATHVREFLKQAKAALAAGDVDGARTLAAKAKVLLGELIAP